MTDLADPIAARSDDMTAWTQRRDPLLGPMPAPAFDEHVVAELGSSSGRALAVDRVLHTPTTDARSLWGASTSDHLQLRLDEAATLDDVTEVLDGWLCRAPAAVAEPGGDHARVLRLPVVARQVVRPLIERGFTPATSTLVRRVRDDDGRGVVSSGARAGSADAGSADAGGADVRKASLEDREPMVALTRELLETEAQLGTVRHRDRGLGDEYVDDALGHGDGWTRVATHDDTVIGWAGLAPPADSTWAAPSTSAQRVAYLGTATVTATARSRGVGRALAAALHARAHADGVDATLLDASVLNPWSMPFWHRTGYRPLWTTWQRVVPGR